VIGADAFSNAQLEQLQSLIGLAMGATAQALAKFVDVRIGMGT
jgi:hypothetical protein